MATITDLNSLLERVKAARTEEDGSIKELGELSTEIINILLDEQEMFQRMEHSGKRGVIRQFLKADHDIITPQSIKKITDLGVVNKHYSDLIEKNQQYTDMKVLEAINTLVLGKTPDSFTQSFLRLSKEINQELRKQAETSFDPITNKEFVIEFSSEMPKHRQVDSILDCLQIDLWYKGIKVTPEQAWKHGIYLRVDKAKVYDKQASKFIGVMQATEKVDAEGNVILNEKGERQYNEPNSNDTPHMSAENFAYFTINSEKTVEKMNAYMQENLYLIKSLEIKKDFSDSFKLIESCFLDPMYGVILSLTHNHIVIDLAYKYKSTIVGNLLKRPVNTAKRTNQNGYIDAVMSITDGKTPPTGINEKNMRIDQQTVINKYFAKDPRIFRKAVEESELTGFPTPAIARTTKVLKSPGAGVFLAVQFKGEEVWVPIEQDFVATHEFDAFWKESHRTGDSLNQKKDTRGSMSSIVTSVDGYFDPNTIDLENNKMKQ